ncbi:MAG: hypothetical protein EBV41_07255, partial [Actinobacteria bacterium]|nr:hypothetical protein [Actinomycetota bacterium]
VRTPRQTLQMIRDDLDTATALVTARVIAGDAGFGGALIDKCQRRLRRAGQRWVGDLHARVLQRHRDFGEVAFLLEPNLKEGLGGLRDIHALWWANAVGFALSDADLRVLDECNQVLLRVRSALHTTTGRPGDVLHLQDQASVAHEAGFAHDDALMAAIADAGTRVMWIADQTWARLDPPVNRSPQPQLLAPGVALVNGEIHLADDVDPAADPTLTLRVATAAARQGARIDRDSLDRLGRFARVLPEPWPAGASDDLVALLLEGERAIPVWETLDARDLIVRILPEWRAVRCRPQRNAFHRFTVDRHLWQELERDIRPNKLGHLLMFTHDYDKSEAFYVNALGLRITDKVPGKVAFLSGGKGIRDHHCFGLIPSTHRGFQHGSFHVDSVDDIGFGALQMRKAGFKEGFGLGRHAIASNLFYYVRDPWGSWVEYYTDMDKISEAWQSREWNG